MRSAKPVMCVAAALLLLAAAGAGCGGDDSSGMAGIYRVTAHTLHRPCASAGDPQPIDPPFFLVKDEPLVNGLFVDVYPCDGPARASCHEQGISILFLGHKVGEGEFAAGTLNYSQSGGSCEMLWLGARVKKTADGVILTEESRTSTGPASACESRSDSQLDRAHTFACQSLEAHVAVAAGTP